MKERILAVMRLIATFVGFVNAQLVAAGCNPIPFDETLVTEWATYIVAVGLIAWAWWKDAPMTKEAIKAHIEMISEKIFNKLSIEAREELSNGKGEEVDE